MTNEEAIAIIRKEYLCVDRDCDIERSCGKCDLMMLTKEPILEAYNMAIKALEQEPKTGHCKDCKYCGEVLKDNLHSCNNNKSIFKACLETATGCEKFEPQESEDNR